MPGPVFHLRDTPNARFAFPTRETCSGTDGRFHVSRSHFSLLANKLGRGVSFCCGTKT